MKTIILTIIFTVTVAAPLLADDTTLSTNENTRVSYALGMMLGESWKAHNITNLDYDTLLRGLNDAESGGATLMTVSEMQTTLMQFQQQLARQAEEKRQELAAKNQKISDAFLAKNKEEPGVMTLPDGLQYKVISEGSGPIPTNSDTVTVSYEGTLIDGTVFDKSDKTSFQVGGVIPGWREALTRMKVGSEWKLFIPPDLAYGPYGRPPKIEPNDTLIFDLHLISIQHPQPVTSDIIEVPSAQQMKEGAKVKIIKPEDVQKMQEQEQSGK